MLLKDLMNEFLNEDSSALPQFLPLTVGTEIEESRFEEWNEAESPRRLIKDYQFNDRNVMSRFVFGLMKFEDAIGHHAKIIIDYLAVRVEVYTHDVEDITELDNEYACYADSLFADVE